MKRYLRAAWDFILPRTCIVCDRSLYLDESHICLCCRMDMPLTRYWERKHNPMADRFNERIQERVVRQEGMTVHEHYSCAAALFFYHSEAGYRQIPYHVKYHGDIEAGRFFGSMLGRKLAGSPLWADVDMVIPVPLHWSRRWMRGYNQAEIIAQTVAEALGKPLRTDILERRRRTRTQVNIRIEEKGKNVEGAFAVRGKAAKEFGGGYGRGVGDGGGGDGGRRFSPGGSKDASAVSYVRHILLVDDVFTTGSTLEACHCALRKVFPPSVRISVATLGYLER